MQGPHKVCPVCREPASLDAQVCQVCGHAYRTQFTPPDPTQAFGAPQPPPPPGPPPAPPAYGAYPPQYPPQPPPYGPYPPPGYWVRPGIAMTPGTHSPAIAVFLSLCLCCSAGQFYNRQWAKGLVMIAAAIACSAATSGLFAPIFWVVAIVDAGMIASRLDRGENVGEWQFF